VLEITPGAFRVRFHRARQALAKHLDAGGHEHVMTPAADEPHAESAP
jgi:hypothetical protein